MQQTEIATALLNASDAERLEKAGFRWLKGAGSLHYGGHYWIVDNEIPTSMSESIDDALLGILERMVWKKGWCIYRYNTEVKDRTVKTVPSNKWWQDNEIIIHFSATEREEFEAFLEILEKEES